MALLFGISLLVIAIRELGSRPLPIDVTNRGIMLYAKGSVSPVLSRDVFIPWPRVESMEYFSQKKARLAGLTWAGAWGGFTGPMHVLKVRTEPGWPPPGTLRDDLRTRKAKPGEIYINASECSPARAQL